MTDYSKNFLNSLTQNLDIKIKICLDQEHDRLWTEMRARKDYDLWFVLNGSLQISYKHCSYKLVPGDFFLLYPNQFYQASCLTDSCHFLFIHFDACLGSNFRALDEFPFDGIIPGAAVQKESALFLENYHKFRENALFSALSLQGSFLSLLARLLECRAENMPDLSSAPQPKKPSLLRLAFILAYIEEHISEKIAVTELAAAAGMTPKYFIAFFRKTIGVTPFRYITQIKMQKALQYLYEETYTVKEIALQVGYEDPYTFSKAFKRVYGFAPSKAE